MDQNYQPQQPNQQYNNGYGNNNGYQNNGGFQNNGVINVISFIFYFMAGMCSAMM